MMVKAKGDSMQYKTELKEMRAKQSEVLLVNAALMPKIQVAHTNMYTVPTYEGTYVCDVKREGRGQ